MKRVESSRYSRKHLLKKNADPLYGLTSYPKLSIFFLAFLPLFVSPNAASPMVQMFFLSAVFMGMTLVIFILYGIMATGVRAYVVNSPRVISGLKRSFAAIFAVLGLKLAMTEQ